MPVYPRSTHLKIPMIYSSLLGIFPVDLMFEGYPFFRKIYARYSIIMIIYYAFFVVTAYMKLYELVRDPDPRLDEISRNLCITLIYTITVVRQVIMKTDQGIRNIIKKIIANEEYIQGSDDKKIKQIFNDCANDTTSKCKTYLIILFIITMLYIVRPLFVEGYIKVADNSTAVIKSLPLSSWFPFDEQIFYLAAYIWHIFDSLIGASFVTYTDILMFSIIVYPTGQLRILRHVVRNFESYKQRIKRYYNIGTDEEAAIVTFRECIFKHKDEISYVDNFNSTMSTLMVFDFLQSSLQIATILTQILGNDVTLILVLFVGAFFVGMILRLVLYYYYANDVVLLSADLSVSLWQSNWYEQSPQVKFMMMIFMMRCQKSLKLFIGPFSVMSLDSLISILKATYSYIMLMYGVN
ncbi:odorant receptor 30a-like [Rhynchophorus ferrugineus]|uniref:odorant receptor 30a-like n=1 Tax=Rhynchophorus ferrugineus TaxID=354439 RepID=UPI003FCC9609